MKESNLYFLEDSVLIGNGDETWKEVSELPASTITKRDEDVEMLSGIIVYGYESKFSKTPNQNGEIYERGCMDEFINEYFIERKLNMPLTIEHMHDIEHLAGRVIYLEENGTGFYYVAYIPKTYMHYDDVKGLLQNGILQGFSKEGWSVDYEYKYNEDGEFSHVLIKKMKLLSVSLVSLPANGIPLEKIKEVRNGLRYQKQAQNKFKRLFV